jgi:outer membrane protein OmpA-like peptidoglycan-associated protein
MVNQSMQAVQAYQQKLSQDMAQKVREELKKQGLPF